MALRLMTAEDLWELPDDGQRHWLIEGTLCTLALHGDDHGRLAMHLSLPLAVIVVRRRLGAAYAAGTGFLLARDPDTVLSADLAFVRHERVRPFGAQPPGYFVGHPDLVAVVVSMNEPDGAAFDAVEMWLAHGTLVVLVADARQRQVTLHRPGAGPGQRERRTLAEIDDLVIDDLFPGWSLPVASLFAERPALPE
jgi:Uma2 family endonuclease